jgi:hypothetical protein
MASKKQQKRSLPLQKEEERVAKRQRLEGDDADGRRPIPTPPPRPRLLSEYDAEDLERTRPLSPLFMKADTDCAAVDDDDLDWDDERLDELAKLEKQRWVTRVARTPLPPSFYGMHTGWTEFVIVYGGSRFIDCCRPPGKQPCSCGADLSCIRDHPERGPVRWHRVHYVPEACCSCLGLLFECADGELSAVCGDCHDCYVVV